MFHQENLDPVYVNHKDWRAEGAVGPIRNEYSPKICQACWAFAVTSALESAYFIKSGDDKELFQFSAQQLVDCNSTSYGCDGGGIDDSFEYYKKAGLIEEE